jgi:hypothetical protein
MFLHDPVLDSLTVELCLLEDALAYCIFVAVVRARVWVRSRVMLG